MMSIRVPKYPGASNGAMPDIPKRAELRARVRFIHDKHYISKDDGTITDKDINAAIDDTLALVEQEIAEALKECVPVYEVSSDAKVYIPELDIPDIPVPESTGGD